VVLIGGCSSYFSNINRIQRTLLLSKTRGACWPRKRRVRRNLFDEFFDFEMFPSLSICFFFFVGAKVYLGCFTFYLVYLRLLSSLGQSSIRLDAAVKEVESGKSVIASLESQLSVAHKDIASQKEVVQTHLNSIATLKSQADAAKLATVSAEAVVQAHINTIAKLKEQAESAQRNVSSQQEAIKSHIATIESLHVQLETSKKNADAQGHMVKTHVQTISSLKAECEASTVRFVS
jgi:hypothetical protein